MRLAVVCPEGGLFGPVTMRLAVIQAAERHRLETLHVLVPDDAIDLSAVLSDLRAMHVDGVMVLRWTDGVAALAEGIKQDFPTVIISGSALSPGEFGVHLLQQSAGSDVTKHLFDAGCRHVAHFAGPTNWIDAAERAKGWRAATAGADDCALVETGSWGSQGAYSAARELLEAGWIPDGVFAANDLIALGVMKAVTEAGRSIPGDVAIAGFDSIAGSEAFIPPLTSVSVPFAAAGKAGVDQMLSVLQDGVGGVVSYHPTLVVRESTTR